MTPEERRRFIDALRECLGLDPIPPDLTDEQRRAATQHASRTRWARVRAHTSGSPDTH